MYANRRNFRVLQEIGVEEHEGDVRFFTGSGNTAVSRMRNESGHNCWNSSFIMDVAMGRYHVPQNAFLVLTMEPFSFTFHVSKILWQTLIGELLYRDRKRDQVCV